MTVNTNRAQRLQKLKRKHARRILFITFICLTLAGTTILLAFGSRPGSSAGAGPSSTPAVTPTAPVPSLSSGLPVITSSPSAGKKPYISPAPSVIATPAVTPAGSFNNLVNPAGSTIRTRFAVPKGWERVETAQGSFAEYLRELPLKADGKPLFTGTASPTITPPTPPCLTVPCPSATSSAPIPSYTCMPTGSIPQSSMTSFVLPSITALYVILSTICRAIAPTMP